MTLKGFLIILGFLTICAIVSFFVVDKYPPKLPEPDKLPPQYLDTIEECEHYGKCPTPLYVGECNPECKKRHNKKEDPENE
jgi:hypothetical protein